MARLPPVSAPFETALAQSHSIVLPAATVMLPVTMFAPSLSIVSLASLSLSFTALYSRTALSITSIN